MSQPTISNRVIEITVSPTGDTKVQTRGFSGPSCRDTSRFIEQALGEKTGEQLTAEFHRSSVAQQQSAQQT